MEEEIAKLPAGAHAVVEAAPGAGKTHLLVALSQRAPSTLILAYNNQLAADITRALEARKTDQHETLCVTFHGLCARCVPGGARDDAQLLAAIERLDRGEVVATRVPHVAQVLIDEAQDVRPVYVRLLRSLGLLDGEKSRPRLFIVGDRNQLIYDFDEDFPASLEVLTTPRRAVGVVGAAPWYRVVANMTWRLTPAMCVLVNALFGTEIACANPAPDASRVEIRCPANMYKLYEALRDIVFEESSILLLVDHRRHNAPLRALLNALSRAGHAVHVHGVDNEREDARVRCATYWSAKGLQHDTVVVLLPERAARNPTYVALTRAYRRLVVVLDPREPHAGVCHAVRARPQHFALQDAAATNAVVKGSAHTSGVVTVSAIARSLTPRERGQGGRVRNLDTAAPRASVVEAVCVVKTLAEDGVEDPEGSTEGADVLTQMVRLGLELRRGGAVRLVESILSPPRMDAATRDDAILVGFSGYAISSTTPQDALLSPDLVAVLSAAYARLQEDAATAPTVTRPARASLIDLFDVACATLAWNNLEHIMRQRKAPNTWDAVSAALRWVDHVVPSDAVCDTVSVARVPDELFTLVADVHARVHARCALRAYHLVWDLASSDVAGAATRALIHPQRVCWILALASFSVVEVRVHDDVALWRAVLA